MQQIIDRGLTEEQRMMRETIRTFVNADVVPFMRKNWQLEWDMTPENRPSVELLQGAHKIGVRTLERVRSVNYARSRSWATSACLSCRHCDGCQDRGAAL